jgi:putative DNA primase/helicase
MIYRSTVAVSGKQQENTFIKGQKGKRFISCQNGIIDLNKFIEGDDDCLIIHTPNFFTVSSLPYNYRPGAESKILKKYLDKSQPDLQGQGFLQEWAGYNLTHDTKLETIVILQGKGKNGKSVFAILLKMLLGNGNFSAVAPEDLGKDPKLLMLLGKRANICDDTNENVKINFGTLKMVVSGSDVSVERKYKTSITFSPTAKHTLIGNQYMVVSDRSDGTIRRIFPIHFGVQISKEERDLRLIDRDFWYDSKEIEGVLYWALLGLRRLKENNWEWTTVDASEQIKNEIKEESQPEIGFFKQCLEESKDDNHRIGCKQLHEIYTEWMGRSKAQLKQQTLIKAFLEFFSDSSMSTHASTAKAWEGRQRYLNKIRTIVPASPEAYSGKHNDSIYALNDAYRESQNEITKLKELIKHQSTSMKEQSKAVKEQIENTAYLNDCLTYVWKKLEDPKLNLKMNIKDIQKN